MQYGFAGGSYMREEKMRAYITHKKMLCKIGKNVHLFVLLKTLLILFKTYVNFATKPGFGTEAAYSLPPEAQGQLHVICLQQIAVPQKFLRRTVRSDTAF